jgi:ribosomal protein S18 acetylase RimI-like enzyme
MTYSIGGIESQKDVRGILLTFSEVWGAETLSELIASFQDTECLVIRKDTEVIGYLFYGTDTRGFAEITDIGVRESFRGKGIGKLLVKNIIDAHVTVKLSVKADNPARFLYEKLGFKYIYTVENYYGVGFNGMRMVHTKAPSDSLSLLPKDICNETMPLKYNSVFVNKLADILA